ncbi:cholinesterase 1-like [Strongylocentrotus purpuratus]|uniref:Carboxylic ester hydrolase n=1 Tax=Strongylocentrotus purpuratus TaxID=7668 RepID=A0A7M7SSS7_STRPU|nr:cholinesterase 1-like [Strongylocentrotus purpuratus]
MQGVPFADPPGRFEPPQPKRRWFGQWNATTYRTACLQTPVASFYFPDFMDEDCLYLNIFVPNPKPHKAAVMLWIHGGGFESGTASTYDFYGVPLVAVGDVIIVTINYRLGVFGFLSTDDDKATGNYGMLDQVAALSWVKSNIEERERERKREGERDILDSCFYISSFLVAFGGDSERITLFGESAGASSVNFHMLSQLSTGIFHQAILQVSISILFLRFRDSNKLYNSYLLIICLGASAFSNFAYQPDRSAEKRYAEETGEELGCDSSSSNELIECLKGINARRLRAVADRVYPAYSVSVDRYFLTDTPANLYRRGDVQHPTLLIGFNKDEGSIRVFGENLAYAGSTKGPPINKSNPEESVKASSAKYGLGDSILQEAMLQEYTDWAKADDPDAEFLDELIHFHGDFDFICPTITTSRLHAEAGDTVFQYFMTHEPSMSYLQYRNLLPSTPWLKAGHTEDLTFVGVCPSSKNWMMSMGIT